LRVSVAKTSIFFRNTNNKGKEFGFNP